MKQYPPVGWKQPDTDLSKILFIKEKGLLNEDDVLYIWALHQKLFGETPLNKGAGSTCQDCLRTAVRDILIKLS